MALARNDQEYAEVAENAAPRVVDEYAEVAENAAPRVVAEFLEVAELAAPRTTQVYLEIADRVPPVENAAAPNIIEMSFDVLIQAETTTPDPTPPSSSVEIKRVARTAPDVVLKADGTIDTEAWTALFPTKVVTDWGRLKLVIGGTDVTFWRGVPALVQGWTKAEPFGDATCSILFPQIHPAEAIPAFLGDPEAGDGRNVDLYRRAPNGTVTVRFEGLIASYEDTPEGLMVQVTGAIHQGDLFLRRPWLYEDVIPSDIGNIIAGELSPFGDRSRRSWRIKPCITSLTGIEILSHGEWQPVVTGYLTDVLALAWVDDGSTQWTIRKNAGRQPEMVLKDATTQHYSIHVAEQGVEIDLRLDVTQAPTTVYGEGTDADNCKWYNAKYPNLHPDGSPVFFGTPIGPAPDSSHNDSMLIWEQRMHDAGWIHIIPDGIYTEDEEYWVRLFQALAGVTVNGIIGPQTWAATFHTSADQGDITQAYIAPIFSLPFTEHHLYAPDGSRISSNPAFDQSRLRVERKESFGSHITKKEGTRSASLEVNRDYPASYIGTITLTMDPPECSRFDIVEGTNILLREHRGVDRLMHIAQVDVDWTNQSVVLTVDERLRDYMTLAAMLKRDRDTTDPARRKVNTRRNRNKSQEQLDTIPVWDCENGAGIVPYHATEGGKWNVIRIPAGKIGSVPRVEFHLDTPSRMAVGIFDRPVSANRLASIGAPAPQAGDPLYWRAEADSSTFWDLFGDELIVAWGDVDQPGGYSPGLESHNYPLTGDLFDNAGWFFRSSNSPWLWVAIWTESGNASNVNYFSGRLFASNEPT